jgi:hypothetical protein
VTEGAVGKHISAIHIGMMSKPARGAVGVQSRCPTASTASASIPRRSMTDVKSYFIASTHILSKIHYYFLLYL